MASRKVAFTPGWIKNKDSYKYSDPFKYILNFYLWGNPCKQVSSSGRTMEKRGWGKDVWRKKELRTYLFIQAGLVNGKNFVKSKSIDDIAKAVSTVDLNGHFQEKRDCNRLAFYSDDKQPDFLQIIFYIRCAFAHGRFERYENETTYYAIEAVTRKPGSNDCVLKARMMIKEDTLVEWAKTIVAGEKEFREKNHKLIDHVKHLIKKQIEAGQSQNKAAIIRATGIDTVIAKECFTAMSKDAEIVFDKKSKRWTVMK
ncbi:MAG: hypothetical protein J5544_06335 [Clostridia bacterium]|nr:hypothetical protein [Clostridia bacterium]